MNSFSPRWPITFKILFCNEVFSWVKKGRQLLKFYESVCFQERFLDEEVSCASVRLCVCVCGDCLFLKNLWKEQCSAVILAAKSTSPWKLGGKTLSIRMKYACWWHIPLPLLQASVGLWLSFFFSCAMTGILLMFKPRYLLVRL